MVLMSHVLYLNNNYVKRVCCIKQSYAASSILFTGWTVNRPSTTPDSVLSHVDRDTHRWLWHCLWLASTPDWCLESIHWNGGIVPAEWLGQKAAHHNTQCQAEYQWTEPCCGVQNLASHLGYCRCWYWCARTAVRVWRQWEATWRKKDPSREQRKQFWTRTHGHFLHRCSKVRWLRRALHKGTGSHRP